MSLRKSVAESIHNLAVNFLVFCLLADQAQHWIYYQQTNHASIPAPAPVPNPASGRCSLAAPRVSVIDTGSFDGIPADLLCQLWRTA